jgi:hypothetical protein
MPDESPLNGAPDGAENFYPLDEATIAFFAEGTKQLEMVQAQMSGALQLYLKQHKLDGRWRIAQNGRELQRMLDVPAAVSG